MHFTLGFDEVAATRRDCTGGKGANLALLTQRGFDVPPGFMVSAAAYREFIDAAPGFAAAVARLPFGNAAELRVACTKLCADLARLPLPPALADDVKARLATWPVAQAVAVRSSSTLEDLANAAFAGQHETFLNCLGPAQILARLKECWLSLWSDRAVAYRHQQGFEHQHAAMAVVVQQMVACEAAGSASVSIRCRASSAR
jgi:rifampicin phosphotransferase